jgi:hypothetical protein
MDEVIGDLCLESLMEFIQTQVFGRDNGNIFICAKMRQGSRFVCCLLIPGVTIDDIAVAMLPGDFLIAYENLKIACSRVLSQALCGYDFFEPKNNYKNTRACRGILAGVKEDNMNKFYTMLFAALLLLAGCDVPVKTGQPRPAGADTIEPLTIQAGPSTASAARAVRPRYYRPLFGWRRNPCFG